MSQTILLIDFENVRDVALGSLPPDYRVLIFVGRSQNSIPFNITRDAQLLGGRLEWIKIEGDGRNNLDFHLAFYLGQLSARHRDSEFLVLSKDKGFDAVIRHATGTGLKCSRIESLSAAPSAEAPSEDPHFTKALRILSGIEKKSRPRKRQTLATQVSSFFQKKEPPEEIQRVLNVFFARKLVSEASNTLTYHF
jgi:hypothetical protein